MCPKSEKKSKKVNHAKSGGFQNWMNKVQKQKKHTKTRQKNTKLIKPRKKPNKARRKETLTERMRKGNKNCQKSSRMGDNPPECEELGGNTTSSKRPAFPRL